MFGCIYDTTYSRNIWAVFNQRFPDIIIWRQCSLNCSYIKGDKNKHISPKNFNTHGLQKSGDMEVWQIQSLNNFTDLFTKALPTTTLRKMVNMKCVNSKIFCRNQGECVISRFIHCTLFLSTFLSHWFFW